MPKRKYDGHYLEFGFTFVERSGEQLPQWLLFHKTLSKDSMKPHQLRQHLVKVHSDWADKNREFFLIKAENLKGMRMDSATSFPVQVKAIFEVSYAAALLVTNAKEPHNIAEKLLKPCLVTCTNILSG